MKLTHIVISLVTALVILCHGAYATFDSQNRRTEAYSIHLKLSNLRSAYLQRAGVVRYDQTNMSSAGLRQQLRRHFDVVLGLLLVSTPRSIDTAVARLEAADNHAWSFEERIAWRKRLLTMRYIQMQRLAAYRDRGLFPLNEGQTIRAVPIFVDRHDTACAVGHLMRLSGWTTAVSNIQKANNLVYVSDAMRSAVTSWSLTCGLTWEEAALIQPAYGWPGEFNAANYELGELALEKNGMRFENVQLHAANFITPIPGGNVDVCFIFPDVCTLAPGPVPELNRLGLLTGQGFYAFNGFQYPQHTPTGTHWLAIAGYRFDNTPPFDDSLHSLQASAAENRGQWVLIRFDVSATGPDKRINGVAESSYLYQSGFHDPQGFSEPNAVYSLKTTVRDGGTLIDTLLINQTTVPLGYYQKLDTSQFSPRVKLSVESTIWLQDGVAIDTFLLDFNLVTVPEPVSGSLAIIGAIVFAVVTTRHRRKR